METSSIMAESKLRSGPLLARSEARRKAPLARPPKKLQNFNRRTVKSVCAVRDEFKEKCENFMDLSEAQQKNALIGFFYKNVERIELNLVNALRTYKNHPDPAKKLLILRMRVQIFYVRFGNLEAVIHDELLNDGMDQCLLTVMVAVSELRRFRLGSSSTQRKSGMKRRAAQLQPSADKILSHNVRNLLKSIYKFNQQNAINKS